MKRGDSRSGSTIDFLYVFKLVEGRARCFEVSLDKDTLNYLAPQIDPPEWTRLMFNQCPHCPLEPGQSAHCPVAYNISTVVDAFRGLSSTEAAQVMVYSGEREYLKSTSLKEGLSSLIGLCMAASPCPHMGKLKPLVRHHLPFASFEETVTRVASTYLMIQFFLHKKGMEPDWTLKRLPMIYDNIKLVNTGISGRIRQAAEKDASLNAIANLDYMASTLPYVINETLEDIEMSLGSYLEG